MKAQLTIQYLASFIFFIGLIILIYFSYSANIPRFIEEVEKEDVRSKAYQLSEMLVNDPGEPNDWNTLINDDGLKRIGFSDVDKTNLILSSKITKFNSFFDCSSESDFKKVQDRLGLNRSFLFYIFSIDNDGNRNELLKCVPPAFPKTAINATVKRITAYDTGTELAELIVQM